MPKLRYKGKRKTEDQLDVEADTSDKVVPWEEVKQRIGFSDNHTVAPDDLRQLVVDLSLQLEFAKARLIETVADINSCNPNRMPIKYITKQRWADMMSLLVQQFDAKLQRIPQLYIEQRTG